MGFPLLIIIGILLLSYSYLLYPLLIKYLSKKLQNQVAHAISSHRPALSIIIAAHNEEKVLKDKLDSILNSNYPPEKIELLIGIDNSEDFTSIIANEYQSKFADCQVIEFEKRQGKIQIVNALVPKATNDLIVLTDANVLFTPQTLIYLQAPFEDPHVGLVDTRMQHYGIKQTGISIPESQYIANEVAIKDAEGKLWGAMMGPFGGCFAFRKKCFEPIPAHFLVDDFYINMTCIEKGYKCINQKEAVVLEDVSNDSMIEFLRKVRISAGNFQNLKRFWPLLFKFNWVGVAFFSHKVLRWLLPSFLFLMCIYIVLNRNESLILQLSYYVLLCIPMIFIVDYVLKQNGKHFVWLRFPLHFISMNLALFIGMLKFFGGIQSSIWQPTKRHQ